MASGQKAGLTGQDKVPPTAMANPAFNVDQQVTFVVQQQDAAAFEGQRLALHWASAKVPLCGAQIATY
ncbi:MAG: hypothetical protein FRX49_13592 [Trebouxia sp. A1-2]|nr:MAG: hypothetical protein FRX49_13592 [Trebouxia sp. A1-2]